MPMFTMFEGLAGVAPPLRPCARLGEVGHLIEDAVHLGDDVDAVDHQGRVPRHSQGDVQDRAVLRDIDVLTGEHRVAPLRDAWTRGRARARSRSVSSVDEVLGVVEVETLGLEVESLAATGVLVEEFAQMKRLDIRAVRREGGPTGTFRTRVKGHRVVHSSLNLAR